MQPITVQIRIHLSDVYEFWLSDIWMSLYKRISDFDMRRLFSKLLLVIVCNIRVGIYVTSFSNIVQHQAIVVSTLVKLWFIIHALLLTQITLVANSKHCQMQTLNKVLTVSILSIF